MSGCLPYLRVLDMSRVFAGPWAGQLLADFGADVIKIEHPETGDDARYLGVHRVDENGDDTGETSSFLAMNRGKRSVAVDLKTPEGQEIIRKLAAKSDVLIENFKTGTLDRYQLGYEDLRAVNPKLVYCSITGFGQTGPYSDQPGYDPLFQAMSGLMSITGVPDGEPGAGPNLVGFSVSDIIAGLYATIAILGAVNHRDRSGEGQHIDLALLDSQIAALSHIGMNYLVSGKMPARSGAASQITCPWQAFPCSDMDLMIAVGNDRQFKRLCKVLELENLADDPRFQTNRERMRNKSALLPLLTTAFSRRTAGEWHEALKEAGVPSGPIKDFGQALQDPQVQHRQMVFDLPHPRTGSLSLFANPIKFSGTPVGYSRLPPRLGEHTQSVLAEVLHLTQQQIDDLLDSKVVGSLVE
jgi:crotonobetainyl-CoA:carnitine CoA-transferase CaiB-like acyl-CoA transferase